MKKHLGAGLAVLALFVSLTACGGSDSGTTTATTSPATTSATESPTESATAAADAELMVASSSLGDIVVYAKGMSLYFYTKDVKDSGVSACVDKCLVAWPPLFTESDTPTADGVTGELGTIPTPDGKKQVTLNGMPLYYYQKDTKAGDITGQDVGQVWYLSDPAGNMITTKPAG